MFRFPAHRTLSRFRWTVTLPALLLISGAVLLALNLTPQSPPLQDPPRTLFHKITARPGRIFYLGVQRTTAQYRNIKQHESRTLQQSLERRYRIKFKSRSTRYFNFAYRCPEHRINRLVRYLNSFFKEIYPRYFRWEPQTPFNIVYFRNKAEFTRHTGSHAYGFFRPAERTLYSWNGSGHGTLWHEMIHAFVHDNSEHFIPQWFNEGLTSFYEMAFLRNGKVSEGSSNWRMPRLHEAIRTGKAPHLRDFLQRDWMQVDFGYAQARFFFCMLWKKHKMVPFVRKYLYTLLPAYSGKELGRQTVKLAEKLTGKNIEEINREFLQLAKNTPKNRKLIRQPPGYRAGARNGKTRL